MHPIGTSLLILGFACVRATAQQLDTTATSFTPAVVHRSASSARAAAEKRRRRPDIIEAKDLSEKVMWLARGRYVGMTVLTAADEQTTYVIVRRTISSQPEVHARWDDIVLVRSGVGVIVFGDSLVASTLRAPGERRGGKFTTNYQIVVHPGDVVRVPAAVPHAFVVSGAEPLEYLLIKTRRQQLPIRWASGP
jgi:mannose-6-phosphate isomerase-like protein (cupin superfamily)